MIGDRRYLLPIFLAVLFVAAEAIIATGSNGGREAHMIYAAECLIQAAILGLLCWFTARLTAPSHQLNQRNWYAAAQVFLCVVVVVFVSLRGNFTHSTASVKTSWWPGLNASAFHILAHVIPAELALGVMNVVSYTIPVALILILFRVPWTAMGLGSFRGGAEKCAALWLIPPMVICLVVFRFSILSMGYTWLVNFLQNGFGEEFLFRGALLGRLRTLMPSSWAIVAQALLFGFWHVHVGIAHPSALAFELSSAIANHAVVGLALGYLALRSGNIAIPTGFHLMLDSIG